MLFIYLSAVAFLVLPLASSITLFSSEHSRSERADRSSPREVDYGLALVTALLLTILVGVVLYSVLFTTYPLLHDATHHMRHGMAVIPCH